MRCLSVDPFGSIPAVSCELNRGHDGLHRVGTLTWHDPNRILVGGVEPDLAADSDHWVGGDVVLSTDEPLL